MDVIVWWQACLFTSTQSSNELQADRASCKRAARVPTWCFELSRDDSYTPAHDCTPITAFAFLVTRWRIVQENVFFRHNLQNHGAKYCVRGVLRALLFLIRLNECVKNMNTPAAKMWMFTLKVIVHILAALLFFLCQTATADRQLVSSHLNLWIHLNIWIWKTTSSVVKDMLAFRHFSLYTHTHIHTLQ